MWFQVLIQSLLLLGVVKCLLNAAVFDERVDCSPGPLEFLVDWRFHADLECYGLDQLETAGGK